MNPNVYLNQTADQAWVETKYRPSDEEGLLKTNIERVSLKGGTVTLDPFGGEARKLMDVNGNATLQNNYQTIELALNSRFDSGGQAQVQGRWANQKLNLNANTKDFRVVPWTHFLPELPLQIQSGEVDGKFQVTYALQDPVVVKAKATIENGRTQLADPKINLGAKSLETDLEIRYPPDQSPTITGTAKVNQADARIPEDLVLRNGRSQSQQARQVRGDIQFRDQRAQYDLTGELSQGGEFRVRGLSALDLSESNVLLSGNNIPAALFDQAYALPIQVQSGTVDSNLRIKLRKIKTRTYRDGQN
ncbi:MAG: DUF748 domain-containing protein [Acaryochloridaceae cyanobacterium RL_2_7]|nr:DUF748 domain-containing protein [Acaryochloridaceae cyanobacterium RL_2_7]